MHTLAQMLELSRQEFDRNLAGLTDEDARKRIEPMNCISWIVAHVANQHHTIFVDWPAGRRTDARYQPFGYQAPASQPPLDEALALWRDACQESDAWLQTADEAALAQVTPFFGENMGSLLVRCIYHTWHHAGEINAIRQLLGHRAAEFVDMHDWQYPGPETP